MNMTGCDISFSLRAATDSDEDFIRNIYLDWLSDRLGLEQFPEPMRNSLLEMQWRGHRFSLRGSRPDAVSSVVEVAGAPVGWMLVDRTGESIHLVELHVAPRWRGRGLGRSLIAALQLEAAAAGRAVSLFVHHDNPQAHALYRRMGFIDMILAAGETSPPTSPPEGTFLHWTPR